MLSEKVFFPQRVASEKVRNVRVPRNYFLFTYSHWERPFGESFSKNFLPSKSRQRETPKIAGWIIFLCPSMGRARNIGFYALFSKIFCFRLQIGAVFRLWHQNWCRFRERDFCCGIKIDAILITSSLIPSGNSHLARCFWKNPLIICCCAGIRLLPLHLLHVWKPFCDPLTYSQWERHFFK